MAALLEILDFVVLLLLVIHVTRMLWKQQAQGFGWKLLSIVAAIALLFLSYVSFSSYIGLVAVASTLTQIIFLVLLLGMAAVLVPNRSS